MEEPSGRAVDLAYQAYREATGAARAKGWVSIVQSIAKRAARHGGRLVRSLVSGSTTSVRVTLPEVYPGQSAAPCLQLQLSARHALGATCRGI